MCSMRGSLEKAMGGRNSWDGGFMKKTSADNIFVKIDRCMPEIIQSKQTLFLMEQSVGVYLGC